MNRRKFITTSAAALAATQLPATPEPEVLDFVFSKTCVAEFRHFGIERRLEYLRNEGLIPQGLKLVSWEHDQRPVCEDPADPKYNPDGHLGELRLKMVREA